jgi:hypothetical protein
MDHERRVIQMTCRSSTPTFRMDTATEKHPGRAREELLSKGYAFLGTQSGAPRASFTYRCRPPYSRYARLGELE